MQAGLRLGQARLRLGKLLPQVVSLDSTTHSETEYLGAQLVACDGRVGPGVADILDGRTGDHHDGDSGQIVQ